MRQECIANTLLTLYNLRDLELCTYHIKAVTDLERKFGDITV